MLFVLNQISLIIKDNLAFFYFNGFLRASSSANIEKFSLEYIVFVKRSLLIPFSVIKKAIHDDFGAQMQILV